MGRNEINGTKPHSAAAEFDTRKKKGNPLLRQAGIFGLVIWAVGCAFWFSPMLLVSPEGEAGERFAPRIQPIPVYGQEPAPLEQDGYIAVSLFSSLLMVFLEDGYLGALVMVVLPAIVVLASNIAAITISLFFKPGGEPKRLRLAAILYLVSFNAISAVLCFAAFAKVMKKAAAQVGESHGNGYSGMQASHGVVNTAA